MLNLVTDGLRFYIFFSFLFCVPHTVHVNTQLFADNNIIKNNRVCVNIVSLCSQVLS